MYADDMLLSSIFLFAWIIKQSDTIDFPTMDQSFLLVNWYFAIASTLNSLFLEVKRREYSYVSLPSQEELLLRGATSLIHNFH